MYEKNEERHVLIGSVHGAFANCDNNMPGIYVSTDDSSNLQFLYQEALSSGTFAHFQLKIDSFHLVLFLFTLSQVFSCYTLDLSLLN